MYIEKMSIITNLFLFIGKNLVKVFLKGFSKFHLQYETTWTQSIFSWSLIGELFPFVFLFGKNNKTKHENESKQKVEFIYLYMYAINIYQGHLAKIEIIPNYPPISTLIAK